MFLLIISTNSFGNCVFNNNGYWTATNNSNCTVNLDNFPVNNDLKILDLNNINNVKYDLLNDVKNKIIINTSNDTSILNLHFNSSKNIVNIHPDIEIYNTYIKDYFEIVGYGDNEINFHGSLTIDGANGGLEGQYGNKISIFGDYNFTVSNQAIGVLSRAVKSEGKNTLITLNNINATTYSNINNSLLLVLSGKIIVNGDLKLQDYGNSTSSNLIGIYNAGILEVNGKSNFIIDKYSESNKSLEVTNNSIVYFNDELNINYKNNNTNNTSITNANKSTINLFKNILSTGDKIAINNNNSTINFFGNNNTFDGVINNINSGDINLFGEINNFNGTGQHINNGLINLSNYDEKKPIQGTLFGTLNIGGAFEGGSSQATSGILKIDTKLDSDDLTKNNTDFITIDGGATGSTELKVINAGGNGARTYNKGIHIIQTQTSTSDAFFIGNKGHVTAGAYDYGLFLDSNNWYLRSHRNDGGVDPEIPVYTPDVGEYLATETMGNTLFTSRLEDREGASQYQNLGNSKDVGNVWVRAYGGHNQFKTMESQLKTTGNSFVTQMGTALVTLGEQDQYNLGAMTGFAYYDGKTRSSLTDRESKTKIDGYSLGFYGTWYAHPVEQRGTYIDSWVLWNKFNNSIDTPDQNKYKFNSSGVTASIEVGGDYLINKNGKKNWWVQPQSQIIYQGVHAENFQDAQGVDVYHGKDNVQMRMGVKTYLDIPTSGNKFTSYRPYIALNYIQNTNPYSVFIHDERYENEGSEKQGEIKFGIEGNTTKNSQVWLNASYATGSHNNEVYQGNIGWKYNF